MPPDLYVNTMYKYTFCYSFYFRFVFFFIYFSTNIRLVGLILNLTYSFVIQLYISYVRVFLFISDFVEKLKKNNL